MLSYSDVVKNNTIPSLIITVGISGSGKSTWIKSLDLLNTIVVSRDNLRKELTGDVSNHTKENMVTYLTFKNTVDALNLGINVIFDATNVKSKDRKYLIKHLKDNVSVKFNTYAKIFYSEPSISKNRIKSDITNKIDRSNVPDEAIDKQYVRFKAGLNLIESDGYIIID